MVIDIIGFKILLVIALKSMLSTSAMIKMKFYLNNVALKFSFMQLNT